MKSKMLTVIKKEFSRFFGDKRMVFSTLILPALMIYVLYSFMGDGLMDQFTVEDTYVSKIYVCNMPESLDPVFKELSVEIMTDKSNVEDMKEAVQKKEVDMLAVFPEDFDNKVQTFDQMTAKLSYITILLRQNRTIFTLLQKKSLTHMKTVYVINSI